MVRWLHFVGVTFIFSAAILLLITTISAPVIGDIAILKVLLKNQTDIRHSSVTFGTFGHCVLDVAPVETDQDYCYPKSIGYRPAAIMNMIDGSSFNTVGTGTVDKLTYAFMLHPIASGLAFIAGLFALGNVLGSLVGSMVGLLAWLITVVVMAIDFAVFTVIKNHVNNDDSGSNAFFSVGMWTCLAAMIILLLGIIIVFFTCCADRKKRRAKNSMDHENNRNGRRRKKHGHRKRRSKSQYKRGGAAAKSGGYAEDGYIHGGGAIKP